MSKQNFNPAEALKANLAKAKPFLAIPVYGLNNCLCIRDEDQKLVPLFIHIIPPTVDFSVKHEKTSSFILRFTKGFGSDIAQVAADPSKKDAVAEKMLKEAAGKEVSEILQAAVEIVTIGRDAMKTLTRQGQYGEDGDYFDIRLIDDPDQREVEQEKTPDVVVIPMTFIEESEFQHLGMQVIGSIQSGAISDANIPVAVKEFPLDAKTGELTGKEAVTTVKASKSGEVPRNLRGITPASEQADS